MAKKTSGLPADFDLKVNPAELIAEPARLPSYLDRGDRFHSFESAVEDNKQRETVKEQVQKTVEIPPRAAPSIAVASKKEVVVEPVMNPIEKPRKKVTEPIRHHMNATPEMDGKIREIIEVLNRQSPDGRVTTSEIFQALTILLYDVRENINGRLPERGRWGTPMAKSYPTALAKVFQEAMQSAWEKEETNSFKAVVGG